MLLKKNRHKEKSYNYTLTDAEIGTLEVTHKKGLKNFNIRLRPFQNVQITAPFNTKKSQVLTLIANKKNWIIKKQLLNKRIENTKTNFDIHQEISTFQHKIIIVRGNGAKLRITGKAPLFNIEVPDFVDTQTSLFQDNVRELITFILKQEAKQHIPDRLKTLAKQHGFKYAKLTLRNNKTNWGSCSGQGNISLNIQLMRLPEPHIDYVILHELCHTVHHNHGPKFKELLYNIMPEAPKIEKQMKNYRTQIF